MNEKLNSILDNAKKAYKESVIIDNEVLQNSLICIISEAKILIDNYDLENTKVLSKGDKVISEASEIKKIKRKIPIWLDRPHQINHKILTTFMRLSENNKFSIPISTLEKNLEIDDFKSNYNQMKTISERNHGKVFQEQNGEITLWQPIADFIIDEYLKKFK
jgi:hypothetical protein